MCMHIHIMIYRTIVTQMLYIQSQPFGILFPLESDEPNIQSLLVSDSGLLAFYVSLRFTQ